MMVMADHITGQQVKELRKKLRMTQAEMAKEFGITRSAYANWEVEQNGIPDSALPRLYKMGLGSELGAPSIPASELQIPIHFIGLVNASTPADWADPSDTDSMEFVPLEMGDARGRFAARVESDCMYPLLHPDDLIVLQSSKTPRIGLVVVFRTTDGRVTIKQLKHDGSKFILHALNPSVPDQPADGSVVGYLVGIVRQIGRRKMTDFDPDGIRP